MTILHGLKSSSPNYRDYIAMLVMVMIPLFMSPEITIYNIKFYGIGIFIALIWYLGATRTTSNHGPTSKGWKDEV